MSRGGIIVTSLEQGSLGELKGEIKPKIKSSSHLRKDSSHKLRQSGTVSPPGAASTSFAKAAGSRSQLSERNKKVVVIDEEARGDADNMHRMLTQVLTTSQPKTPVPFYSKTSPMNSKATV